MSSSDRIDFARRSFAANRQVAERQLTTLKEDAHCMSMFRHKKRKLSLLMRLFGSILYILDKSKVIRDLKMLRGKISFYRKIESDLALGNVDSAIKALSILAPREETLMEIARRRTPATVTAILNTPHIMRINMLQLRDDLLATKTSAS